MYSFFPFCALQGKVENSLSLFASLLLVPSDGHEFLSYPWNYHLAAPPDICINWLFCLLGRISFQEWITVMVVPIRPILQYNYEYVTAECISIIRRICAEIWTFFEGYTNVVMKAMLLIHCWISEGNKRKKLLWDYLW